MQGKDTTISTFHQLFGPVCSEKFQQQLQEMEVDKYAKKLYTIQLIELIAHAQLDQHRGLRDISNSLNDDKISEGTSEQAVENQIFIALITYCLLMLMKLKVGYKGPLLTIPVSANRSLPSSKSFTGSPNEAQEADEG